jgi:hypothetical protein
LWSENERDRGIIERKIKKKKKKKVNGFTAT